MSAIVPMVTPATEIPDMILMMLWDFFEMRYRLAMYMGTFNVLKILTVDNNWMSCDFHHLQYSLISPAALE
jgi:hypothetical protein